MAAHESQDHNVASVLAAKISAARLDWIVPAWPAPANVGALSTTRDDGQGANMSLGFGGAVRAGGDTAEAVVASRARLAAFVPAPPVWLRQVHGASVVTLDTASAAAARAQPPQADAAVTRERAIVCAVLTADCLPVLFADRRGNAVGIAHAGWRGLAAGVLGSAVDALRALGARPSDLAVWLGPAIGPQAFEVGRDVYDAFVANDPVAAGCFVPHRDGKWLADLYALARRRLAAAGVHDVHGGGYCTMTDARFHSHRRDHAGGRMASLVWLAPRDTRTATI